MFLHLHDSWSVQITLCIYWWAVTLLTPAQWDRGVFRSLKVEVLIWALTHLCSPFMANATGLFSGQSWGTLFTDTSESCFLMFFVTFNKSFTFYSCLLFLFFFNSKLFTLTVPQYKHTVPSEIGIADSFFQTNTKNQLYMLKSKHIFRNV